MLVGVASLSPSLNPTLWNIGILQYKQAKLPNHLQHSVSWLPKSEWQFFSDELKLDLVETQDSSCLVEFGCVVCGDFLAL